MAAADGPSGSDAEDRLVEAATAMSMAPTARVSRATRHALSPDGSRHLEGEGALVVQGGQLQHLTDPPLRVALGDVADGYVCTHVEGTREFFLAPASAPTAPSLVVTVLDEDADTRTLAAALGASVRRADDGTPVLVQYAASAIETTGKVAASALVAGAALVDTGLGAALQAFKTNVRARRARPREEGAASGPPRRCGTPHALAPPALAHAQVAPTAEPVRVGSTTATVIDATSSVTAAAEDLTASVRSGVGAAASSVGGAAAATITRDGASGAPVRGSVVGRSVAALGSASASAVSEVYSAVETSTNTVLGAGSATAAGAVGHRYGEEAEAAAAKVGGSVQSAGRAVLNVASFGIKSISRAVAKETAKGVATNVLVTPQAAAADGSTAPVSSPPAAAAAVVSHVT